MKAALQSISSLLRRSVGVMQQRCVATHRCALPSYPASPSHACKRTRVPPNSQRCFHALRLARSCRFVSLHLPNNKLGKIADDIQCACSRMEVRRVPLSWVGSLLECHDELTKLSALASGQ